MNFDYTPEQREIRDEARRFLTDVAPLSAARAVLDGRQPYDDRLWSRIAEQGWLGAAIPEAQGGLGLELVELGAIGEEIGASLSPVPFGSTLYMLSQALLLAGSEAQKQKWLPAIAAGEIVGCGAIFEGNGDYDAGRIATRVEGGRLSGRKLPVIDGGIADVAVVAAREAGEVGLYLVSLKEDGVDTQSLEAIDGSVDVAMLTFDGAPAERLPGGGDVVEQLLARAAVLYAFEQIGGADRCLRAAIAYVNQREAFGGPIGRFQAVKHKLADIFVGNELARSHAYHGVWAIDQGGPLMLAAAAAARVAASEAYWNAAREGLHLHGAIGFTWEHDSHLFYRRAHHLSLVVGSPRWWKDRLFDRIAADAKLISGR